MAKETELETGAESATSPETASAASQTGAESQVDTPIVETLETRVKAFNGELATLLQKYQLELGGQAFIAPDGSVQGKPVVVDGKPKPEIIVP